MGLYSIKYAGFRGVSLTLVFLALTITSGTEAMASVRPRVKLHTRYTITNSAEVVPLGDLVAQFLETEPTTTNTLRTYRVALDHFVTFAGREMGRKGSLLPYSQITRALVAAFRSERMKSSAASTARLHVAAVKRFGRWSSERFGLPNPAYGLKPAKLETPEFKGLTEQQYRRVLAVVKQEPDYRRRFLVRLLLWAGLRNDEARNITLGQISKNSEYLLAVEGKSAARRDIPIAADLRLAIAEYMIDRGPGSPTHLLIPGVCTEHLGNKTIWQWTHDALIRAGVPADLAHPHTLRHTYAHRTLARLTAAGEPFERALRTLMLWLGHQSIETTMIYLGLDRHDRRSWEIFQQVEDY